VVQVDVQADGRVLWNGEDVTAGPALESKLQAAAALPEQPELHLRPDRAVDYGVVARVLAAAQRDGVTRLGVVGSEQFLP
jgi:biopolymer transport protein ExbD